MDTSMQPACSSESTIAIRSIRRLIRLQNSDGSFLYKYDPLEGIKAPFRYNVVRHAGCAYALCWAFSRKEMKEEEGLERTARLAIKYLIQLLKEYGSSIYVHECGSYIGNLGATALLSCALSFEPFHTDFADLNRNLLSSLLDAQRDDGSFVCKFNSLSSSDGKSQNYYPGETLLAIARYLENNSGYPLPSSAIEKAFGYYRALFTATPHTGMVLWHADAWTRFYRLAKTTPALARGSTSNYLEFAIQLIEWMLPHQIQLAAGPESLVGGFLMGIEPGVGSASYVEAFLRVYHTLSVERRKNDIQRYQPYIDSGLRFISRLHFSSDNFSTEVSHWTAGGTPRSFTQKRFRMDYDQHVITLCLTAFDTLRLD